ncbi:hypothetical protein QBC41DRAFT_226373 [Cercophora samala]|uniref:Uncharacterized protein n=1 Tax=Cercophora samala TaxID=330535 RepID=A0AA39ZCG2_9PEZI|nr:hypothetical protein QBC41DRAFT_226373 [Cercophora samala]
MNPNNNSSGHLRIPLPTAPTPLMCLDVEINGHPITALASMTIEYTIISLELAQHLNLPMEERQHRDPLLLKLPNGQSAVQEGTVMATITRAHEELPSWVPRLQPCNVVQGLVHDLVLGFDCVQTCLRAVPYMGNYTKPWYRLLSENPPRTGEYELKTRMSLPVPPLGDRAVLLGVMGMFRDQDMFMIGYLNDAVVLAVLDGASSGCFIAASYVRRKGMRVEELGPEEAYTLLFIDGSTATCSSVVRGVTWRPSDNSSISGRTCVVDFFVFEDNRFEGQIILGNNYIDAFKLCKGPESVPDFVEFKIHSLTSTPSLEQELEIAWFLKATRAGVKVGDTWLEIGLQAGVAMVESGLGAANIKAEDSRVLQDRGERHLSSSESVLELTMR